MSFVGTHFFVHHASPLAHVRDTPFIASRLLLCHCVLWASLQGTCVEVLDLTKGELKTDADPLRYSRCMAFCVHRNLFALL